MTLIFLSPLMLLMLPLVLLPYIKRRPAALPLSSIDPYTNLPSSWRERLSRWQPTLASIVFLLLITALAQPTLEKSTSVTLRQGVNLMLVLDISASMHADDIKPNRMVVARETAADFLKSRKDDKVGVILFSGVPFLLAPPTDDQTPVIERLLRIEPDRIGSGTAIGDALAAATARLPRAQAQQSAVILLTDGSSNRGQISPLTAARAAKVLGIKVYTIGFGSTGGAFLPSFNGQPPQKVILDETPLQLIAEITGGRYFRATGLAELEQVYRQIDGLEKTVLEVRQQITRNPLQPVILNLTALLFMLDFILFRIILRRVP